MGLVSVACVLIVGQWSVVLANALIGRMEIEALGALDGDDSDDDDAEAALFDALREGFIRVHDGDPTAALTAAADSDGVIHGVGVRARRAFGRGEFVCQARAASSVSSGKPVSNGQTRRARASSLSSGKPAPNGQTRRGRRGPPAGSRCQKRVMYVRARRPPVLRNARLARGRRACARG